MNKYEAGEQFCKVLSENPNDFVVGKSEHREHRTYAITHIKSGVAVRFEHHDVTGNLNVIGSAKDDINHVSTTALRFLLDWAEDRLIKDKVQHEMDEDKATIKKLLSHYQG